MLHPTAAAALLVVLSPAIPSAVTGQETDVGELEVRIVARKLESGRVEFGLQQRHTDNTWGNRQLPNTRFFPTTAPTRRWLVSSPLHLKGSPTRPDDPRRHRRQHPGSM